MIDEEVLGLEIAVNNAVLVQVGERHDHHREVGAGVGHREVPEGLKQRQRVAAVEVLHHQVQVPLRLPASRRLEETKKTKRRSKKGQLPKLKHTYTNPRVKLMSAARPLTPSPPPPVSLTPNHCQTQI